MLLAWWTENYVIKVFRLDWERWRCCYVFHCGGGVASTWLLYNSDDLQREGRRDLKKASTLFETGCCSHVIYRKPYSCLQDSVHDGELLFAFWWNVHTAPDKTEPTARRKRVHGHLNKANVTCKGWISLWSNKSLEWRDSNANEEKSCNPGVKIWYGHGLEAHKPHSVPVIW